MSDPGGPDSDVDVEQGAVMAQAAGTEIHVEKQRVISAAKQASEFLADAKSCKVRSPSRPPEPLCPQCGERLVIREEVLLLVFTFGIIRLSDKKL